MTKLRSDFLRVLQERGYIHQCTDLDGLDAKACSGVVTAYVGYDATGDSLHIGHLVSIMMLRWMQKTGHKPIALMGGGTTKVGDPSGKDETRKLLSGEEIDANIASIKQTFENFLNFGGGPADAIMVNNADWLDELAYIPFLREVGRHFTINRMLTFDSVKLRLEREQPLTFLEFNYMILQAYDFHELSKRHDCDLQMGGSDQWGNIVSGADLARRISGAELFGLTTPLITTSSGAKMGKTTQGAVWLNPDRLSAYDYWQFWRNTDDGDVARFMRLFTDLPLDEIARLEKLKDQEINEAKKVLADAATVLCRGEDAAKEAAETARRTFEEGAAAAGLPVVEITLKEIESGIAAFEAFRRAGLASSSSEARRLIKGGGARINDEKITSETEDIPLDALDADGVMKLSAGKKRHALIRAV
ncbi:MAG: tyrosine--tRNA ligase [Alphaproteobacteria bacterium]|nr:tyrosine--tRNA ligase [Alphaproteobacteria bacterium]